MRKLLGRFMARPKITYFAATASAVFLILLAVISQYFPASNGRDMTLVLLVLGVVLFSLLSWFSYVLTSRRDMKRLQNAVQKNATTMQNKMQQTVQNISQNITTAQKEHITEYNNQAYNLLISVQQLRLAVLEEQDHDLREK